MGQTVTQSQQADLTAILSSSTNAAVEGLTLTDVTVQYRKAGDAAFSVKSLTPTSAAVTSGNAETYALVDGQTLLVAVDGAAPATATFNTGDFIDIANATAAEVAAVITTDITGATAADVGGYVVITATSTGDSSQLEVTGGTANTALGFSTTVVNGTTFFFEIGSGVYEIRFTASELDTLGSFVYTVNGSTITQFVGEADVEAVTVAPVLVAVQTCTVTGHLKTLAGTALANAAVSARIIGKPTIDNNLAYEDALTSTTTNSNGEFFIELPRLAFVEVYIPKVNYRRQLTVPNRATANLFTEVP